MNSSFDLARDCGNRHAVNAPHVFVVIYALLLAVLTPFAAKAQEQPIIQQGDAVVTGYSGVALLQPGPGAKPEDYAIINHQGATLQVFDLSQMQGGDDGRLVDAQRFFSVTAGEIGQVFGVALDDGRDGRGPEPVPSIYATAASVFGLQIVETTNGVRNRTTTGGPNRTWMDGQFGLGRGGGPGSIWKIDGRTGEISLFADVTLNGLPNNGPALGNITFDPSSRKLFVSDLQTGMIHAFDLNGAEVAVFDHGASARPRLGLPAVPYDPAGGVEITSTAFNALDPATWGYADRARSVWGLAVSGGRLFYAVAEGPEIWSVGIGKNGTFANDARVEIQVRAPSADPIADITFGGDGTLYLSQRGQGLASYDYTALARSNTASVLRYGKRKLPSGRVTWQPIPDEYAVGFEADYRNANGGVALGYGYDRFGYIRYDACESTLWSTGELLRHNAQQADQLTPGGPMIVHGLQGNGLQSVRPANEGPFQSYFIDFDSNHADPTHRGHMGDVAIWSSCPGTAPPRPPTGPAIRITKSCSPATFGGDMFCRVTLTSTGSEAPKGPVGFSDFATIFEGPAGINPNPLLVSATPDGPEWGCSEVPATFLECAIDGAVLTPGRSRSVDIVMDISEVSDGIDWRVRNCATLDGTNQSSCVTRGDNDTLIVAKTGPDQVPCVAGGPCDFEVTVINPGKRTFDGDLFFGDNLTIGGAPASGVSVDAVIPSQGCAISNLSLPLQWQCHTTIPPGGFKSFNILLTIPAGAVPAGVTQGRNCFVATDPHLAQSSSAAPTGFFGGVFNALSGNSGQPDFWTTLLDPANNGFAPGRDCIDFDLAPGTPVARPPGLPAGSKMTFVASPSPSTFSAAGETITYSYRLQNTGSGPITSFDIKDTRVSNFQCPSLLAKFMANPNAAPLAPGEALTCTGTTTTLAGDVGKDITSTATASFSTAAGAAPPPPSVPLLVKFVKPPVAKPSLSVSATPAPHTFAAAGEKIALTYTVTNTGTVPVATFEIKDGKATDIKCAPANSGPSGGPLAPGASATCTGGYTTTAGDVGQDIAAKASLTGTTAADPVPPPPPATWLVTFVKPPLTGNPSMSVSVTPVPDTFSAEKQKLTYNYTVTNTGNVPASLSLLTDTKATGIGCQWPLPGQTGTSMPAGASVSCSGTYTTTAADVGKDIASTATLAGATATGPVPAPAPANAVVKFVKPAPPVQPQMSLAVTPSPATFSAANEKIAYTYEVKNTGTVAIPFFLLGHTEAAGLTCPNLPVSSICPASRSDMTCSALAAGASVTCTGAYTTTASDVGKDIENLAMLRGETAVPANFAAVQLAVLSAVKSADAVNLTASTVVKFVPPATPPKPVGKPELSLEVAASQPTFSAAGETITYTYTVKNSGTAELLTFRIADTKATGIACVPPPPLAGWSGGPVAPGASVTCKGTYTTTAGDVGKDISSTAKIDSFSVATVIVGTQSPPPVTTLVKFLKPKPAGKPELNLTASASPKSFTAEGQSITFTYKLTNSGKGDINDSLALYELSPNKRRITGLCGSWPTTLAAGKTADCTFKYETTAADVGKDIEVENRATGNTASPPVIASNKTNTVVEFAGRPDLRVFVYQTDPDTFSAAGEKIAYRYSFMNLGNVPVASFTVSDSKVKNIKCEPANTGPSGGPLPVTNGIVFCAGTYTTTAADVGKDIESEVKVSGKTASGPVAPSPMHTKTLVVKFAAPPELKITQYVTDVLSFSGAGQLVRYQYTVSNTGAVPIESFVLTDSKVTGIRCGGGGQIPVKDIEVCTGSYTTTAADVGKDLVSEARAVGKAASGATSPAATDKRVVKYEKPKAPPQPSHEGFKISAMETFPSSFSKAGQEIKYIIRIEANCGCRISNKPNEPAFRITGSDKIKDVKCADTFTGSIGRGEIVVQTHCKGEFTTTTADIGKNIDLWAEIEAMTAAGPVPGVPKDRQTSSVSWVAPPVVAAKPSFSLHHECSPKVYSAPGQTIGCEFVVKNTGTIPIKSCKITGSRLSATCPPGLIPPGDSVLIKSSYTTTAADVGKNIVIDYKLEGTAQ